MTQISKLPQIDGTRTKFTITLNAVFTWSIFFPMPVGPQEAIVAPATMVAGSATLANLPTATVSSLVTGQGVSGYGIPDGTTISAIPSTSSVTLSAEATQSGAANGVTFTPLPLDLTGIAFRQQIRASASDETIYADLSTDNGLLINGGASGVLAGYVPPSALKGLEPAVEIDLVTDIVATADDGGPVNLMGLTAPASVVVRRGVTR